MPRAAFGAAAPAPAKLTRPSPTRAVMTVMTRPGEDAAFARHHGEDYNPRRPVSLGQPVWPRSATRVRAPTELLHSGRNRHTLPPHLTFSFRVGVSTCRGLGVVGDRTASSESRSTQGRDAPMAPRTPSTAPQARRRTASPGRDVRPVSPLTPAPPEDAPPSPPTCSRPSLQNKDSRTGLHRLRPAAAGQFESAVYSVDPLGGSSHNETGGTRTTRVSTVAVSFYGSAEDAA
jgi:hypothetical protein